MEACGPADQFKNPNCLPDCPPQKSHTGSDEYFNGVFVYDTQSDEFGIATASSSKEPCLLPPGCGPFPINDNLPQVRTRTRTQISTQPAKYTHTSFTTS